MPLDPDRSTTPSSPCNLWACMKTNAPEKTFDCDAMNRLHAKGMMQGPGNH